MGSFLLQHQMDEPLQRSHITKHVGGILETLQVYIGIEAATARPRRIPGFELIAGKRGSSRFTRSAKDYQVAAGLFECFFRCGDLVLWAKPFALYETIPRPDRPREQFPGLLRARFVTVPNGIDRKLQRTQNLRNVLHFADSFVCQSPLRIFFFGFRFSVLNQIDVHDRWLVSH